MPLAWGSNFRAAPSAARRRGPGGQEGAEAGAELPPRLAPEDFSGPHSPPRTRG